MNDVMNLQVEPKDLSDNDLRWRAIALSMVMAEAVDAQEVINSITTTQAIVECGREIIKRGERMLFDQSMGEINE